MDFFSPGKLKIYGEEFPAGDYSWFNIKEFHKILRKLFFISRTRYCLIYKQASALQCNLITLLSAVHWTSAIHRQSQNIYRIWYSTDCSRALMHWSSVSQELSLDTMTSAIRCVNICLILTACSALMHWTSVVSTWRSLISWAFRAVILQYHHQNYV